MDGFSSFIICVNKTSAKHYLFVKQHKTREECELKPHDRTLFVINVPPYLNEKCMEKLFIQYGKVKSVFFHQKPTANVLDNLQETSKYFSEPETVKGYKVAYVVFEKPSSLNKLLKCSDSDRMHHVDLKECQVAVGPRKWSQQYNNSIIDVKDLSVEIEQFMADYDKKVEDEKNKAKELDGIPDEEGWVTVTKHSRKPVIPRTENANSKISAKFKKRRSQKELQNFYSFQIRESKMERLAELRKKFQEDKERIALMKASRKFKPF